MKEELRYRARKFLIQKLTSSRSSDQFTRLEETNWDVLVVLDACRADTLQQVANWPVNTAVSPASCTPEWLQLVASEGILNDTHILSANPQYRKRGVDLGSKKMEPFWETHWENSLQTTLPEPILNRVGEVVEESPNSVVAHLQQPHWPYVAKLGNEWKLAYDDLGPWEIDGNEVTSLQVAMQRGLIDSRSALLAYKSAVQSVWEVLTDYLSQWVNQGNTVVITADHGETFGRFRDFGCYEHPCGCHLRPLVQVPWVELSPTKETEETDTVEERLRALGYAE